MGLPVDGIPVRHVLRSVRPPGRASPRPPRGRPCTSVIPGLTQARPSHTGVEKLYPVTVSNLPFGSGVCQHQRSKAHLPTSAPLRASHQGWYPAGYPRAPGGGAGNAALGFPLPFGRRRSLLGHPVPARGFRSPHGRPTRQRLDPGGVSTFRTSESRPDWAPSLPRGPAVLTRPVRSLRPPLAPSPRGQALSPRARIPSPGAVHYEASSRVHSRSPARPSPSPVGPWMEQGPLGLLSGLRTPAGRTCTAHARAGDGHQALARSYTPGILTGPPSASSLKMCDLVSHDRPGHDPLPHRRLASSPGPGSPPPPASPARGTASPQKGQGDAYLKGYCTQAATGAARTDTFLGERLRRLSRRLGRNKAEMRRRPLHPDHHLAPARRPRRQVHRPRPRLARSARPTATARSAAHLRQLQALGLDVTITHSRLKTKTALTRPVSLSATGR